MPRIQLITNVSEYGLFRGVAQTRGRLVGATLGMMALSAGAGLWAADYVVEASTSVGLNMLIITGVMILLLITSYFMAMLIGDLVFPGPWREQVLLGRQPDEHSALTIEDHNAEFMAILILSVVLNGFLLNIATGDFLKRYHSGGIYSVQLRSENVEDRLFALEAIAQPTNFRNWERPELKLIVQRAFDDPDASVRERAFWTAGHLKDLGAQPALLQAMQGSAAPAEKAAAAVALGKINDPPTSANALQTLATESSDPQVVVGALRGLGLMADEKSLDAAMALTRSPDEDIMLHAWWVLREVKSPAARPLLDEALAAEPTGKARCAILDTLKMLATPDDVMWARRQFQRLPADAYETPACDALIWTDHDDRKYFLLYGDSDGEKLMKIVANADAFHQRDWFQTLVNDPKMPFRIRQVGTAVLKQIDDAKYQK